VQNAADGRVGRDVNALDAHNDIVHSG
jgi:hypothetical protein